MKASESIDIENLWGGDSAPSVDLMRMQMDTLYDLNAWSNNRVKRLCDSAGITLEGLCAMAGVYGKSTIRALVRQADRRELEERSRKEARARRSESHRGGKGPPVAPMWKWPWPIALHFAKVEKFLYEQKFVTPTTIGVEELAVSKIFKARPAEPVALN